MNEFNWYIIKTKPQFEKKVAAILTNMGLINYLPLHRQLKTWHDRKKWVNEVLFKNYLFVYVNQTERLQTFGINGILKYLSNNGKPAILPQTEIDRIKLFCNLTDITIQDNLFIGGDEVEIINGQFIGYKGYLLETTNGNKLKIYIKALNCYASFSINKKDVRKVKKAA